MKTQHLSQFERDFASTVAREWLNDSCPEDIFSGRDTLGRLKAEWRRVVLDDAVRHGIPLAKIIRDQKP